MSDVGYNDIEPNENVNTLIYTVMKTLAVIFYIIGAGLLIASCFTTGIALTWWLGGFAVACLIVGCIFQYNSTSGRRR